MPPWYTNPCWSGIILPITPWVTAAWVVVIVLSVETVGLLAGPLALGAIRRRSSRGALAATLTLALCAVCAGLIANWMTLSDFADCPAPFGHYTPALGALAARHLAELMANVRLAMVGLAILLALSTALTCVVFRRWLRSGGEARQMVSA